MKKLKFKPHIDQSYDGLCILYNRICDAIGAADKIEEINSIFDNVPEYNNDLESTTLSYTVRNALAALKQSIFNKAVDKFKHLTIEYNHEN